MAAKPPRSRCPVCGKVGFRSIRHMGPQLIGTCRAGHPRIVFTPKLRPKVAEVIYAT